MKKIAIISNLPSGGGKTLYESSIRYLKKKYAITEFGSYYPNSIKGIFKYYYAVLVELIHNYHLSKRINKEFDLLIAYQSWLTKSPLIFPLISIPIVYICNEVPREHYDPHAIALQSTKERFVNFVLLFPIKILDWINIKLSKKNIKIITLSRSSSQFISKVYKINPTILHPGINLSGYGTYRDSHERKNQIISVGSINKLKNQMFILQVVAKIPIKMRPSVVLVGNGGDKNYVKTLLDYAEINYIKLNIYSNVTRKKLIEAYKQSYALMYSPINEPYGLVVLEAMKAGLPIIVSSECGGYTEVINNTNGYLLKNDAQVWAQRYIELLKSNGKWNKISRNNYSTVVKHSDYRYFQRLSKLIDKCL